MTTRKRPPYVRIILAWVFVLTAWVVGSYPGVSMWLGDRQYSTDTQNYRHDVIQKAHDNPQELERTLQKADSYNDDLTESFENTKWSLKDPWGGNTGKNDDGSPQGSDDPLNTVGDANPTSAPSNRSGSTHRNTPRDDQDDSSGSPTGEPTGDNPQPHQSATRAYEKYLKTLSPDSDGRIGNLIVPAINVDMPIFHGTTNDVLSKGVGHVYGTHLPTGGRGRHTALSAHSGVKNRTFFDRLPELSIGDKFFIESSGKVLAYRVSKRSVVLPEEVDSLQPQKNKDLATLITCVPYRYNTHRLLVTGERIPLEDANAYGGSYTTPMMVNDTTEMPTENQVNVNDLEYMDQIADETPAVMRWWGQLILFGGLFIVLLLAVWTVYILRSYRGEK